MLPAAMATFRSRFDSRCDPAVLWSHQLEAAENVRKSSSLYARNIGRALRVGREELEREAAEEREAYRS